MGNELIYVDDKAYTVKDIPNVVKNTWDNLQIVKEKSQKATKAANDAKKAVDGMQAVKWYNKKQAIEDVQEAVKGTSTAMSSLAEANQASFEYQQELAKMTKLLFNLGVGTRAATRCVIREVRGLLENASVEELDTLAEEELNRVLMELNAQEDFAEKQQRAFDLLKEQDEKISAQEDILSEQEYQLGEHEKKIKFVANQVKKVNDRSIESEKLVNEQNERISEYGEKIAAGIKKDKEHDKSLREQQQKDLEHDRKIKEGEKKDQEQDRTLENQKQKDLEHDKRLNEGDLKDKKQDKRIETNADNIKNLESYVHNLESLIELQNNKIDELIILLDRIQTNDKKNIKKKWKGSINKRK
ncbi:MAG: hypothetical protein K5776_04620 [Lachnospiraceae bacterium]|nr:hypothetical protein [Lachnospiraceae bacterium]